MAKALTVFVVDIGPHMHMDNELVAEALRTCFLSKAVNKARDECALLYFGATDTKNSVHDEMQEQGSTEDYLHIVEEHPLKPPDQAYLVGLEPGKMPRGQGKSDFIDAVTVAADILNRAVHLRPELEKANVSKEIVLVSSLQVRVKEQDVHEFVAALVDSLKRHDVYLQTVFVDIEKQGQTEDQECNREILSELVEEIRHRDITVQTPSELLGVFKSREYSNTAYYAGPFTVGPDMNIRVKVAKKAKKEMLPSTKLYSERSRAPDATHEVQREHEYKDATDPDTIVPPEERQKAYKYGKQFVPVSADDEAYLAYRPERGILLLGFLPADSVPQYQFMKDPWVMVPEKGNEKSGTALAALVRALQNKQSVALILFLPRVSEKTGGNPTVCAGTPVLGNGAGPDHLVLNHLPFAEDLRVAKFTSFEERQDLLPTAQQVESMNDLVKGLSLQSDKKEMLAADTTRNPTIHRFYNHAACQASGKEYPLPEPQEDVLVRETFLPNAQLVSGSKALLESLPELLPVKIREAGPALHAPKEEEDEEQQDASVAAFSLEGAAAPAVTEVGTSDPVNDFVFMIKHDNLDKAFSGMPKAITSLVQNSMGDRNYHKAATALKALRAEAVQHSRGASFNDTLKELRTLFESSQQHKKFWQLLVDQQVSLVSDDEAPGSGVSAPEAEDFLKHDTSHGQVEEETARMAVDAEAEEEFADME